jgi:phenylacetate-CoA ligase
MSRLLLPRGYRSAELLHKRLSEESEKDWIKRGEKRALRLFWSMSERVPAYKDFLKKNNFSASSVKTIDDFYKIPAIDKDNYLRKYPKNMLCWDGDFPQGQWVISTTSGSTGQPYYFPREESQDWQYAMTAELYLRSNFHIHKKSTLYIVAFPMGAWIGGLFTYEALKIVAEHSGYNLSIITPGIHKQEVINAVLQLGNNYDQIIIGAYAPFLKDILDDGIRAGIDWQKLNLGFVFSAEAFTEQFRDYVTNIVKPENELLYTLNHYGTVDLGTMSHETPESIYLRRKLLAEDKLDALFPEKQRQATFTQYNPELFYFDEVENNLFCTAYSGLPLVRYDLKDYGGIMTRQEIYDKLNISPEKHLSEMTKLGLNDTLWNLPFLYVYERNDFSVSYYAFLIYPDMVRRALQTSQFNKLLTGKFTMLVDYNKEGRQKLHINCEMKHGVKNSDGLNHKVREALHDNLVKESSEYRETVGLVSDEAKPVIKLWDYEDPTYFRAGTKQKWVIK